MPGRLQTGSMVIPYVDESSNLKINDSIRYTAEMAFSPYAEMAVGTNATDDIGTATWTAIAGLDIDLVVPVVSRVIVNVTLKVACTTYAAGEEFKYALYRDGSLLPETEQYWQPAVVLEKNTLSMSYLQDTLLPGNTYAYTVRMAVDGWSSAVYRVVGTRSNMIVMTQGNPRV